MLIYHLSPDAGKLDSPGWMILYMFLLKEYCCW